MKAFRILLCVLTLAALAFCGWFYIGGTLRAQVTRVTAGAEEYPEAFETIRQTIATGGAQQVYVSEDMQDPSEYTLVDVTVLLTNRGLFSAEYLTIEPCGVSGDIALYSLTGEGLDIAPGDSGTINFKLVTRSDTAQRAVRLQYYVFGISRTVTVEY